MLQQLVEKVGVPAPLALGEAGIVLGVVSAVTPQGRASRAPAVAPTAAAGDAGDVGAVGAPVNFNAVISAMVTSGSREGSDADLGVAPEEVRSGNITILLGLLMFPA